MPNLVPPQPVRDPWPGVRAAADETFGPVAEALGGRNGLIEPNWRAHAMWFATTILHQTLDPDAAEQVCGAMVRSAAHEQAEGEAGRTRAERFFASRVEGFDAALEASRMAAELGPLVKYFVACCSTPRVTIAFEDVRASPVCVRSIARRLKMDAKTLRRLEEQVAEPRFAYFLPDDDRDTTIERAMHDVSARVADAVELAVSTPPGALAS